MIVEASITGLLRTLLIIAGVFVLLRFLGQFMNAKRNMEEERAMNERERKLRDEKKRKQAELGKTKVIRRSDRTQAEDVDFEEID